MRRTAKICSTIAAVVVVALLGTASDALACRLGIGNRVWYDVNMNGIQDVGETGINGVRVTISPGYYANPLDPTSFVEAVVTSTDPVAGEGHYRFYPVDCDVLYTIAVDTSSLPSNFLPTGVRVGTNAEVDSDDPAGTAVLLPNKGFDYEDPTIDFGFYPAQPPPPSCGTGTPGYWKRHPEAWPVDSIMVGNVLYTKAQAIARLRPSRGDKSVTMFRALVAAKLNLLNGTDGSCIVDDVTAGDAWLAVYPAGSRVHARSAAWRMGSPIATNLDRYNNGLLCAPHRD